MHLLKRLFDSSLKTPTIFQVHPQECGASCLGMILAYYGVHENPHKLRSLCGVNRNGATVAQIQQGAMELGHKCSISKIGIRALEKIDKPIIIHWDMTHFVVLEKINEDFAWINDPAVGHRKIAIEEFKSAHTGICLIIDVDTSVQEKNSTNQFSKWGDFTKNLISPYLLILLIAIPLLLIAFTDYLYAVLSLFVFDYVVSKELTHWGYASFIIIIFVILGYFLCNKVLNFYIVKLAFNQAAKARSFITQKVTQKPIINFQSVYPIELLDHFSKLNSYCKERVNFIHSVSVSTLLFLLSFAVIAFLSPLLASIVLVPHVLQTFWLFLKRYELREYEMRASQDKREYDYLSLSRSECYERYYAMGMEKHLIMSAIPGFLKMQASKESQANFSLLSNSLSNTTQLISMPIMIFAGSYSVALGLHSFGEILLILAMSTLFNKQMTNIYKVIQTMLVMKPMSQRAVELFYEEEPPVKNQGDIGKLLATNELIRIYNLSFSHEVGGNQLFSGIKASIKRGDIVCVSGPTGCGKTTFLELLIGKYRPKFGCINSWIDPTSEESKWSVILAHDSLMPVSVCQFISGNNNYRLEEIEKALQIVELENRLGYFLGGSGKENITELGLSRGEVHRLLLARALYSKPELLIIDEAFSSISSVQGSRIIERIKENNISIILSTHREEIKELCNLIIPLGNYVMEAANAPMISQG